MTLIKCPYCGADLPEDSEFCNKCGAKLKEDGNEPVKATLPDLTLAEKSHEVHIAKIDFRKFKFTKKKIILSTISLVVVAGVIVTIVLINNPLNQFSIDILQGKYDAANQIYTTKLKPDQQSNADDILNNQLSDVKTQYISNKITFSQATAKLNKIGIVQSQNTNYSPISSFVLSLNQSRESFKNANTAIQAKDYSTALTDYSKVIKEDSDYSTAQDDIVKYKSDYKKQILSKVDGLVANHDYDNALSILTATKALFPNDSDISAKETSVKQQAIDYTKSSQKVIVMSALIHNETDNESDKVLYPDVIQVIYKNVSNQSVKNLEVSCLGFDTNGLPTKIKTWMGTTDYDEFVGTATDANILPNATFGDGYGFKLDWNTDVKKVVACVKDATFYDGTTWTNPYYQYWLAENKDKPLH